MSLEIVGNTINGLSDGSVTTAYELFTSTPTGWTITGDTSDLTYTSTGALVTSLAGSGTSDPEVTFTLDLTKINYFVSVQYSGNPPSGGSNNNVQISVGLDGDLITSTITSFSGLKAISLIRLGDGTWKYLNSGGIGAGARGSLTVTGPGKELTITLKAHGGPGYTGGGVASLSDIMYA